MTFEGNNIIKKRELYLYNQYFHVVINPWKGEIK